MHVGLNLVFMVPGETGGMEVYARELVRRLGARDDLRLTLFVNREAAGSEWGEGAREVVVPVRARRRAGWVLGEQLHLPRLARQSGCHLLHSLASTAPLRGDFPRVTTIHDLNYKLVPEAHFGLLGHGMSVLVPAAARRSHRIIAVSESTARDLAEHLGIARAKVDVVPQGVAAGDTVTPTPAGELRARLGLGDRPLLLTVSAKRPHKNLRRLLEAHARLDADERPVLVLPGYPTPHEQELIRQAGALGTLGDVRFLGWVSAQDLEGLYSAAAAFVFPSLYEGFGLPVLEAMRRGVPVGTSDRASLPEVAGDAALLFDPESVDAIHAAIVRLLSEPELRERLAAAGIARAALFTWDATAERTVEVYRRTLREAGRAADALGVVAADNQLERSL